MSDKKDIYTNCFHPFCFWKYFIFPDKCKYFFTECFYCSKSAEFEKYRHNLLEKSKAVWETRPQDLSSNEFWVYMKFCLGFAVQNQQIFTELRIYSEYQNDTEERWRHSIIKKFQSVCEQSFFSKPLNLWHWFFIRLKNSKSRIDCNFHILHVFNIFYRNPSRNIFITHKYLNYVILYRFIQLILCILLHFL